MASRRRIALVVALLLILAGMHRVGDTPTTDCTPRCIRADPDDRTLDDDATGPYDHPRGRAGRDSTSGSTHTRASGRFRADPDGRMAVWA